MILPMPTPPSPTKVGDCYQDTDGHVHVIVDGGSSIVFDWAEECSHIHLTVEEAFAVIDVLDQFKGHDYVLLTLARRLEVQALHAKKNRETKDERSST